MSETESFFTKREVTDPAEVQRMMLALIEGMSKARGYVDWGDLLWELDSNGVGSRPAGEALDVLLDSRVVEASRRGYYLRIIKKS